MMRRFTPIVVMLSAVPLFAASPVHAARCFSMFDAKNALVFQTANAPIDMSRAISDQMALRFPARYLVISDAGSCPERGPGAIASATSAAALLPSRGADAGDTSDPSPVGDLPARGYAPNDGTTQVGSRTNIDDAAQPGPTGRVRVRR